MRKTLIEHSKTDFSHDKPSLEHVNTGCLQRIANATELMAINFLKLQQDNEYLKNRNHKLNTEVEFLKRQSAVYKGKFNRLRKSK